MCNNTNFRLRRGVLAVFPTRVRNLIMIGVVISMLSISTTGPLLAQEPPPRLLIPIGGGYSDTYPGLAASILAQRRSNDVRILVLAPTYSSNADAITDAERQTNMQDAERRRFEIEGACQRAAPEGVTCTAIIVPVFTRSEALDPAMLAYFTPPPDGVFLLGGDQNVAMQVLANTPLEAALAEAYAAGAVVSGTSAGSSMQSFAMTTGYNSNFAAVNSLDFGATDVWQSEALHGLSFGIRGAIIDQHFFQRSRFGRLLSTIARPDAPHVGLGVDAFTGVRILNETQVGEVFGLYTVTVLDAATYHAAEGVRYVGPRHTLSLRNVLFHLLAPGHEARYDLTTRATSLGAPAPTVTRDFAALDLPAGAGALLLTGDIFNKLEGHPALARFVAESGGAAGRALIVATAYPSEASAQRHAERLAAALGMPAETRVLLADAEALTVPEGVAGIVLTARDASQLAPAHLEAVKQAWLAGAPLLADNAAAALIGSDFVAMEPVERMDDAEFATQKAFWRGKTIHAPGLGLLDIALEPQVLEDNRWGRLISLAYARPERLALGLSKDAALFLTQDGAELAGANVLFVFDLRGAQLGLGDNEAFVIANALVDVFAPGDVVAPTLADVTLVPERMPPPVLAAPASEPTATLEPTATPEPTITPTATPTPPAATPTSMPAAPSADAPRGAPAGLLAGLGLAALGLAALVRRFLKRRQN